MSSSRRKLFCLAGVMLCWLPCFAQSPVKSPVARFRELLAMSPTERQTAIATNPPEIQKRILDKVEEYQLLPAELQDLRLRETELRWFLRPLMDVPQSGRAARLALIPEDERKIVEERLQTWDLVPAQLQEEWKNNDLVANYLAQESSLTDKEREELRRQIPLARRTVLEKGIDRWNALSAPQREKAMAGFNKMFEFTPEEQTNALETASDISAADREQMNETLAEYDKLSPEQRAQCIRSFEKFAAMSVVEREQFLKNADRWSKMTPEERDKWRNLVSVAPIMPRLDGSSPAALPVRPLRTYNPAVATNSRGFDGPVN